MLLLCTEDSLAPRTIRLRNLKWLLRLSHNYIPPLEVLQTLLHTVVRRSRLTITQPSQTVPWVLWRRLNQDILDLYGLKGSSLSASGHGSLLNHVDMRLLAFVLYVAPIASIVHNLPNFGDFLSLVWEIMFVQSVVSSDRAHSA